MEQMLLDPVLALASDTLDDLEDARKAMENRIRALTRTDPDKDGELRGMGLDPSLPPVSEFVAMLADLKATEEAAIRNLQHVFKSHPLYPWCKAQKGIGDKQGARLLAAIGDPYMRPEIVDKEAGTVEPARPRRGPDELKAYCGLHVVDGVVPGRKKGQKVNWNDKARMRFHLVAAKCVQVGQGGRYREVYDIEREYLGDAIHNLDCNRCGPKGKPALAGSDLSDGHKHGRALHKIKQVLAIDLWVESKRLYEVNGWLD